MRLQIFPISYFFTTSKKDWKIKLGEGEIPEWFENRKEKFINSCFIELFRLIRKWRRNKKITCLKEYMSMMKTVKI